MESSVLEQGTGNREKEMEQGDSSELLQASEPVDSTLVFELVGKDSGPWSPTLSLIDQFEKWYPSMDVDSELRKAAAWHATNPTKRKTKSGIAKFLNAWLAKANDRGGINGTNNQPPKQLTLSERLASIRMEDYQQGPRQKRTRPSSVSEFYFPIGRRGPANCRTKRHSSAGSRRG